MARILRARSLTSPKTPRGVQANPKTSASWSDEARRRVTSRVSVRRLMAKDPASVNTRDVIEQFTDNPNPKFDPSRAPGSVQKKDGTPQPPKSFASGHQKVHRFSIFNQNAGKTLKRR